MHIFSSEGVFILISWKIHLNIGILGSLTFWSVRFSGCLLYFFFNFLRLTLMIIFLFVNPCAKFFFIYTTLHLHHAYYLFFTVYLLQGILEPIDKFLQFILGDIIPPRLRLFTILDLIVIIARVPQSMSHAQYLFSLFLLPFKLPAFIPIHLSFNISLQGFSYFYVYFLECIIYHRYGISIAEIQVDYRLFTHAFIPLAFMHLLEA